MPPYSYVSETGRGLRRSRDLATVKEAATRTAKSEAEIIREGIHLAAMRIRRRSQPLRLRRFASGDPGLANRVEELLAEDDTE